jgi:hypothetical protein
VMAPPGGCHPVVAGPTSELLHIWGMASETPQTLRLSDVPASAFLKDVEVALRELTALARRGRIDDMVFNEAAAANHLDEHGQHVLAQVLGEYAFDVCLTRLEEQM